MKALGCEESLDVRRGKAVGEIARNQLALDLTQTTARSGSAGKAKPRRQVMLYLHLSEAALRGAGFETVAGVVPGADPYEVGGPTASDNVARVCRKHHRAKTHGGWSYRIIRPGTYEWTSPHGYRYVRDPSGTIDLNPAAVASVRPLEEWDDLPSPPDE